MSQGEEEVARTAALLAPTTAAGARLPGLALVIGLFSLGGCAGALEGPPPPRPNVVLLSIDTLRPDHLGCYGYGRATSPTIDRLAAEGALFEVVTSSSSWTLPAHAALFTALPDSVHGVDRGSARLLPRRRTLAEALRAAGYRTAAVWTGPLLDPRFGLDQGVEHYVRHVDIEGDWERAVERSHQVVTGPGTVQRAVELLDAVHGEPFFLFVHLWDAHYDYIPPPPHDTMVDPGYSGPVDGHDLVDYVIRPPDDLSAGDVEHLVALYDGEIAWADRQVGAILRKLDALGIANETVVIVTADHGEEFFEHGSFGHKRALFEESIRIPLVMRHPGTVIPGTRVETPVRLVDVAPTILELAGAEPLPEVMGHSLVPLLEGRVPSSPPLAVSELVVGAAGDSSLLALRAPGWKLMVDLPEGEPRGLWDLKADPGEQDNLLGRDRALTARALDALEEASAELERLRALHGRGAGGPALAEDLRRQLESLGYLEEGDSGSLLRLDPNPLRVCDRAGLGVTTVSWQAPPGGGRVEVRVNGPEGKLFALAAGRGSKATGLWARDGTRFFLVDETTRETLARTTLRVTRAGCPSP